MGTDDRCAIFVEEGMRRDIQFLGNFEDIHGTQHDVITIDTALAALRTVELEGIIKTYSKGFDVLEHFFSGHLCCPPNIVCGTGVEAGAAL